jgi:hypothetical protein
MFPITPEQVQMLLNGLVYINIHDEQFPDGEIRGQLIGCPAARLANISTRMQVERDDNVMIGGLIVTGNMPKNVLFRATGPSLGIADQLADPVLELHDTTGQLLATNDNWRDAPNVQAIIDTTIAPHKRPRTRHSDERYPRPVHNDSARSKWWYRHRCG